MTEFNIRRRIYFDDTDGGGVVYHTQYLRYMEHARSDFLIECGFGPQFLIENFNVMFAVTDLSVRYLAPARLGDLIEIDAVVQSLKGATIVFKQSAYLLDSENIRTGELVSAEVKVVCLSSKSFKPVRIPSIVEESILREC